MAEAVAQSFSHEALRAVLAQRSLHCFPDGIDERGAATGAFAVAVRGGGASRAQVFFNSVEFADEIEYPCGIGIGGGFDCLEEVPADVGEAGDEAYTRMQ